MALVIKNLHVNVAGKEILRGINLTVNEGEVHTLMGPNGAGKTTLSNVLMGHPGYEVTKGNILFGGKSILSLTPDQRARKGLFLSFQAPVEIPGVNMTTFLRTAYNSVRKPLPFAEFRDLMKEKMELLKIDPSFGQRYLNTGFSGGEKKKSEILQMALFSPRMAILDETDSGLDIDGVRIVSSGIKKIIGPGMGVLIITHYRKILDYIKPDKVHILIKGKIVKSGGMEIANALERKGFEQFGGV